MNQFDTKKILIGVGACTAAALIATVANSSPFVSQLLSTAPQAGLSAAHTGTSTRVVAPTAAKKVNINTAGADELMTLSGIGAAKAQAVIDYRATHGLFYRTADIENVKGIGPSMFESISNEITVGDVAPPPAHARAAATHSSGEILIEAVAPAEYIELFNASPFAVDISGWSVKKKSSSGAVSTLIASSHLLGKTIGSGRYFLITASNYSGEQVPDARWPASYSLSQKDNGIFLYDKNNTLIDSVSWHFIPSGQSYVRLASATTTFAIASSSPQNSSE